MTNSAALFLPDGFGVTWIDRRSGFELESQVRGVNLMHSFCELSARKGYRHFFYGDTEDVLSRMERKLTERFPGIEIAGSYSPPFRPLTEEEDAGIVDDERTGLHFTPGDAEDLAARVEYAWTHPEHMWEMGREARAEYETKYTAEKNYQMLMDIYERAIENSKKR